MRTLIISRDSQTRRFLASLAFPFGICDLAVSGEDAVGLFRLAAEENGPYDLVLAAGRDLSLDVANEMRRIERETGCAQDRQVRIAAASTDPLLLPEGACDAQLDLPASAEMFWAFLETIGLGESG